MPQMSSRQIPIMGTDLDSSELYINPGKGSFIKNLLNNVSKNPNGDIADGTNLNVLTPLEGNIIVSDQLNLPTGQNYICGYKESVETNEGFVFVYNSEGNHLIYSINGDNGICEIVYQSPQLKFKYKPENFINVTRCVIRVVPYINKFGEKDKRTFIIFTDYENNIRCICKEDSIATNSFDIGLYPFFEPQGISPDELEKVLEEYITLAIAPPMDCIQIIEVPRDSDDKLKQNLLLDRGWEFRIKFVDIYGRETEHGIISDRYFVNSGNTCIKRSSGLPRCLDLKFNCGNPFVNKIQIEYRNCTLNNTDISVDSGWVIADIIYKYQEQQNVNWWERIINPLYSYDLADNTMIYRFCSDKLSQIIDQAETSRLFNPIPLTSASLYAINKGIALVNNERDFEPSDKSELNKISFEVTKPTIDNCDNITLRKIVVYAVVYNQFGSGPINTRVGQVRYNSNNNLYYFSISEPAGIILSNLEYFAPGIDGFIGYLAGTNYVTISKQIVLYTDDYTEGPLDTLNQTRPYLILQKFEFLVIPGKYVFRIASHLVSPADTRYQQTSTNVYGKELIISTTFSIANIEKEFYCDVCNSDYIELEYVLKIYDTNDTPYGVVSGYLFEDEVNRVPIELNPITWDCDETLSCCWYTDHNGYYFSLAKLGSGTRYYWELNFKADLCNTDTVEKHTSGDMAERRRTINVYLFTGSNEFPDIARRYFTGRIHLCNDPSIGIPGIPFVLQNGLVGYSDSNGDIRISAHNRYNSTYVMSCPGFTISAAYQKDWRAAGDTIITSQNGICQLTSCIDCSMCFDNYFRSYELCVGISREYVIPEIEANIRGLNRRGPKNGGRYGLGVVFHDEYGRCGSVQLTESYFIDIPSILETKTFDFSRIGFSIDPGFRAPVWSRWMTFCITKNLNWEDDMMWVIDRVAYVDGAGNEGSPNPTKVRLYYESIVEYAVQNNYSVNSTWDFLDAGDNTKVVTGDRIEFIQKPDGTWFDKTISLLALFDKDGKYVEVDYEDDLKDLVQGTLIKLIRPVVNTTLNNFYFELCPVIKIINQIPQLLTGQFNYFDSYFVNRVIPTPIYTTNPDDPTEQNRSVISRTYVYFYEHHSPSDFWGDHCKTLGRVHVYNPYEKKKFLVSETALSKALLNKSAFFGLSYFELSDVVAFDEKEWGETTAAISDNNTILYLCATDNFVVSFNDNTVRIDTNGNAIAPAGPDRFGKPQRKIGSNYGCKMRDINTITKRNGVVMFLDTTKSKLVAHTFGDANDVSEATGAKSWVIDSIVSMNEINQSSTDNINVIFIAGIDPKNDEYYLTKFFAYSDEIGTTPPTISYINDVPETNIEVPETAVFSIKRNSAPTFKGFVSFTPEYYGSLEGYYLDKKMYTFRMGHAWSHHNKVVTAFNRFYGTNVKKVLEVVCNMAPEKEKRFQAIEVYCKEQIFISDRILTEGGQQSRLLPSRWEKNETFSCAAFVCDLDTPANAQLPIETGANKILDGDVLTGRWLKVRLVSKDTESNIYCEISAILIKFMNAEESGQPVQ